MMKNILFINSPLAKKLFLAAFFGMSSTCLYAQVEPNSLGYYTDALRFSQTSFSGSARYQGIAGAQTALGGDMGSLTGNPAGLGFFRRSEFGFGPGLGLANTQTTSDLLEDRTINDDRAFGNINNFGVVLSMAKDDLEGGAWRGGAFGIAVTRINNFQNQFSYEGINPQSSITDAYTEQAFGIRFQSLENLDLVQYELQRAAYFAYLINPYADADDEYFSYARDDSDNLMADLRQKETVETKGSQYQWSFSYGGNYDDRLYFGLTLGINTINYQREKLFKEEVLYTNSMGRTLLDLAVNDDLNVKGTGVNFTAGIIYRIADIARLGASVSTPTFYSIREEFKTGFVSNFDAVFDVNGDGKTRFEEETLPGEFSYSLSTPFKANFGAAFFVGKYGFITADAEYIAYNGMRLNNLDGISFASDNQTIRNIFKATWNYRIGAEARLDIFRIRGGFALYGDPYKDIDQLDRTVTYITGGLGVRLPEFYVDLGFVRSAFDSIYLPYTLNSNSPYANTEPLTQSKNKLLQTTLSVGFFF